jgi:hypothetical protein
MKPAALRRRLWLPLLLSLAGLVALAAYLFRWIGLGELGVFLGLFTIGFLIESIRYIVGQFLKGYHRKQE